MYLLKKKIIKKIKEFAVNSKQIRFYDSGDPVIFLNLKITTKVRTYNNLIFRIREEYDNPIVIKFSLLKCFFLVTLFQNLKYVYFAKPFKNYTVFKSFGHAKKSDYTINYNYKEIYSQSNYITNALPYIRHPYFYENNHETSFLPKNIGILISGNFEEKIYNSNKMQTNFGLLNRWQVYLNIIKHSDFLQVNGNELIDKLDTGAFKNKMILMKWQSGAISISKWLHYLSASDFFFCTPGMTMPLCHNVLEAMSVGVIPIINYENWLNPSLINNQNCLVYKTETNIMQVIDMALSMSNDDKMKLRENVFNYYNQYYSKYQFQDNQDLIVVNEYHKHLI